MARSRDYCRLFKRATARVVDLQPELVHDNPDLGDGLDIQACVARIKSSMHRPCPALMPPRAFFRSSLHDSDNPDAQVQLDAAANDQVGVMPRHGGRPAEIATFEPHFRGRSQIAQCGACLAMVSVQTRKRNCSGSKYAL